MKSIELLIWLLYFHFIGDVFIRNNLISLFKRKSIKVLAFHCFIWSGTVSIPLVYFNFFSINTFIFLFIGHFIVDLWKGKVDPSSEWIKDGKINTNKYVYIDQAFHFCQLVIVVIYSIII